MLFVLVLNAASSDKKTHGAKLGLLIALMVVTLMFHVFMNYYMYPRMEYLDSVCPSIQGKLDKLPKFIKRINLFNWNYAIPEYNDYEEVYKEGCALDEGKRHNSNFDNPLFSEKGFTVVWVPRSGSTELNGVYDMLNKNLSKYGCVSIKGAGINKYNNVYVYGNEEPKCDFSSKKERVDLNVIAAI
ncbi:hypothetical protein AYI68_g8053 [Smittium mucronatum]|uniref:Uncharacterized protein n=1 Tax=Smittium mucronatum TaxID=133383 RepID=A0A1R0GLY3_9FUNG|nr:hypothetical protein AYI68_g8053 [Smittium mucronatum]